MKRRHFAVLVVAPAALLLWWLIDRLPAWLDEQRTPIEDRGWEDPTEDWPPPGYQGVRFRRG